MDLIGRFVDVLPQPRGRASKADVPANARTATVVSAIEPDVGQLIGALMLWLSLRRSPTPSVYRLCIVDRGSDASALLDTCGELGLEAAPATPRHANPFLNKWLVFDAFAELRHESHVLLLDWDTLLCAPVPLPGPVGSAIAARRNRSGMYRDLINEAAEPLPRTTSVLWGRVRSSVNGGVLIGAGASLHRCADGTIAWLAEVANRAPDVPLWKAEQLALSIAVGEVGLTPLDKRWNVTPQSHSSVADRDVCLWHYNDGVEATHALKRCLDDPRSAREQLARLAPRWPRTVTAFSELYDEVLGLGAVARVLQRKP